MHMTVKGKVTVLSPVPICLRILCWLNVFGEMLGVAVTVAGIYIILSRTSEFNFLYIM